MGRSALFLVIWLGGADGTAESSRGYSVLRLLEETCFLEKRIHSVRTGFPGESCAEVTEVGFCGIELG